MASTFSVVSDYQTTLSSPMTSSQLTVPVNSIVTRDHVPVTLTTALMGTGWYLTIDPGTSAEEFVKIIAVTPGSGVSGIFTVDPDGRGLAYSGNTDAQGTGNAKPHNPGAIVILSNAKNVYDRLVDRESDESVDGIKTFSDSPQVPTPISSEIHAAASVEYVNAVAVAGAPNAAVGVKGIVEIGTQLQVNTGDDSGSTNATSVVIPSTHFQTWDLVVTTDYTYGDTIAVNDLVYVNESTGRWVRADASNALSSLYAFGFALDAGVDGETGKRVQIGGIVTGLSGLNQTAFVYASDTPGQLSTIPGTNKKVVGVSYSATSLIIIPILDVSALFDVNSNVTSQTLNLAADFFTDPAHQGLKTNFTAGQDLAMGEIVAVESDGLIYRVRPTGFSTANAGTATTFATTEMGGAGSMFWFDSSTPTLKTFLGQDNNLSPIGLRCTRVTTDSNFNAISSTATNSFNTGSAISGPWDATLFNTDKIAVCAHIAGGTTVAMACQTITATPTWGSDISLDIATGAAITDTSTTDVLVAFSNPGAGITSYKITNSGATLTESTNSGFLVSATAFPVAAQRFPGGDFIALFFEDSADTSLKVMIGQYNPATGGWVSIGSPVVVDTALATVPSSRVMVEVISSTQLAVCYQSQANFQVATVIVTRSGTTPSVGPVQTQIIAGSATTSIAFKKWGKYSFVVGTNTTAGGKLQLAAATRDFLEIESVGTVLTNAATTLRGIAGCLLTPQRWLAMYQDAATTTSTNTRELTVTLNSALGAVIANVNAASTEDVITTGYSDAIFSGLTPGTAYFTNIDGQLTTSENGVTPLPANNSNSPLTRRAVVATSTTAGQIKI